ncbi:MAG TPA: PadR family transcriptional regulator [Mycobacteriales bacterium]|nr:PadR family transcriptional regulator [Mycobacteriales bacterium]
MKPTPMLLAVLTALYEAPMHPYQLHQILIERGKDLIAEVKPGSIYHAVQRLEKYGLAEELETSRDGRRPERTTYRITDAGRTACLEWIEGMIARPKAEYPQFLAGIASMAALGPDVAERSLRERAEALENEIARHRADLEQNGSFLPRVVLVETEYLIAVRTAELTWARGIIADLRSGALHWDEAMLRRILDQRESP